MNAPATTTPGTVSFQVISKAAVRVAALTGAETAGEEVAIQGLPFEVLGKLYDVSGSIQTCVEAYQANIESNGHLLIAGISLEDNKRAATMVAQAMYEASLILSDDNDDLDDDDREEPDLPDPEEVAAMVLRLRGRMIRERLRVDKFIASCGVRKTWTQLRRDRRLDLERYGNAYWEVVREQVPREELEQDDGGNLMSMPKPVMFARLNPLECRLTKLSEETVVYQRVKTSLVSVELRPTIQRFRRIKQTSDGKVRWFKEFGDPRLMSANSGKFFYGTDVETPEEEMARAESAAEPATEVMHWYLGEGPYGRPRWYGEFQTALGVRKAQETNVVLLGRGGIPGLAIVVSNGSLTEDASKAVKNWAEQELTGPESMNKVLVIQADGADDKAKIELERLNGQQEDGLWLEFIQLGYDLICRAFRLPKLLCGDAADINRATAESALTFAESQVFQAERRTFDEWFSSFLFTELDIRFWDFASKPARLSSAEARATVITEAVKNNWLTIAEARSMGGEVFDRELPVLEGTWTQQPIALTLAGLGAVADPTLEDATDEDETPSSDELADQAAAAIARLRGGPAA